jgi:IMP cyclohydrolase
MQGDRAVITPGKTMSDAGQLAMEIHNKMKSRVKPSPRKINKGIDAVPVLLKLKYQEIFEGGYMTNPNGPYPGRQLFIGLTLNGNPAVVYLVTGRSPASRERKATPIDSGVIIGPLGNQPYDALRHYTAVKYDNVSGILAVSNGIQTDAVFETYKLLFNTNSTPSQDFMEKLLDGAQAEPDSLHTPRIAGIITNTESPQLRFIVGIKRHDMAAKAFQIEPALGTLIGLPVYKGSLENPEGFDPAAGLPKIEFKGKTAIELAEHLFEISKAAYNGDDIRVCAVGGVRADDKHTWQIAVRNR